MRYRHIAGVGASLIATMVVLSGLMYYFNQDSCPAGSFLCFNTTVCMQQRYWCNKYDDCPYGDDELPDNCNDLYGSWEWFATDRTWNYTSCDLSNPPPDCSYDSCTATCNGFVEIPQDLSTEVLTIYLSRNSLSRVPADVLSRYTGLQKLFLDGNNIVEIEDGAFENLSELYWLVLTGNNLERLHRGHFVGLRKLETLRAESNQITFADLTDFDNSTMILLINLNRNLLTTSTLILPRMSELRELKLDENQFDYISEDLFAHTVTLKSVSLENNFIRTIHENAFQNLQQLVDLNLAYNQIKVLSPNTFLATTNVSKLLIGNNPIENVTISLFQPLKHLRSLDVEDISLDNMEKNAFGIFPLLDFVYFKKFHYCTTYAPQVRKCIPASDGVSSFSHLLGKPLLRAAVWGISCVTCMGNALVLWGRFTAKDENRVLSIMIRNLAVSDLLMGVYLFVIAVEDMRFRDNYNQNASTWMSSWSCTLVGILAMTSSEVSVLILSFMSVERFMLIAAPLKGHRATTPQIASSSMIVIWTVGITLALVPAIHWRRSTRFYGVNGMCFPLHIDDPYLIGWEYSAFIFLGLNSLGLITIGYVYAGMFASIWRTQHATPLSVGDSEFAVRFFLIVLTDAACWAPIIILKILALKDYPVPSDLHAWVVVFILPVNSAVNPLLYTFTTPRFRERLSDGWFGKMRSYMSRKQSAQESQISHTVNNRNVVLSLSADGKCPPSEKQQIPPILSLNSEKSANGMHDHIM